MGRKLKMGFLMDPIEQILPDKDTTFVFMLEAGKRDHEALYFTPDTLFAVNSEPYGVLSPIKVKRATPHYKLGHPAKMRLKDLDALFMRVDPPFTLDYLAQTYLLDLIEEDVFVTNRPAALRDASEKLFTLHFPDLIPPTLVTHKMELIRTFIAEVGGKIVLKPLFGCGGSGVFVLRAGDRNVNVIMETATEGGRNRVIAQKYIHEARAGDKRIILLNGEAIGATLRVPREEENRANIHVGGDCVRCALTERDRFIISRVGPALKKRGLHFVGLDVLGDWLTEINVTSPTGVQEINRLENTCLEAQVMDFVEKQVGG